MNRVICDVCGTKYPEASEQCPICGCAKPENARVVSGDAGVNETSSSGNYTHVKGGRFSKANVRKRNKAAAAAQEPKADLETEDISAKKENNKGLVIAVVALLLAIVAVMLFIFFKYFIPAGNMEDTKGTTHPTQTQTVPTTDTVALEYPCTEIDLSATSVQLDAIGSSWLLSAELTPLNTTDVLTFVSANPEIATVTVEGRVTAMAVGETEITVSCGDVTQTCAVIVVDASATTEETVEDTTAATTDDLANWKLNRTDISFTKAEDTWMLYKGDVDTDEITWTSDDPAIATFEKGVVTAVAPGETSVHAEYNGTKYSCIIRCRFKASSENDSTEPEQTTAATEPSDSQAKYALYIDGVNVEKRQWGADVTLSIKESFQLTLRTENGDIIAVTWESTKDGVCSVDGNKITGKAKGNTDIQVNYGGKTYTCKVTVK